MKNIQLQRAIDVEITTQELHSKIEQLEISNDLQHGHLSDRVDDLRDAVKDNRDYFTKAIESLDKKVWALVLLTLSTLLATVASMLVS
jgi:predicted RNA-binding protein with EMAP domain